MHLTRSARGRCHLSARGPAASPSTTYRTSERQRSPRFKKLVEGWVAEGVVAPWTGPVGRLQAGRFTPLTQAEGGTKYVAPRGMRSIAEHIMSKVRR